MSFSEFQYTTDGLRIACARWHSFGPRRGVVQIAQGLGEHIGGYMNCTELYRNILVASTIYNDLAADE